MCENTDNGNNALIDNLREENNRLSNQVLFANKCLSLLDKYRNYLTIICLNCNCDLNMDYKSKFSDLEHEYNTVFNVNTDIDKLMMSEDNSDRNAQQVINDMNVALNDSLTSDRSQLTANEENKFTYYSHSLLSMDNTDINPKLEMNDQILPQIADQNNVTDNQNTGNDDNQLVPILVSDVVKQMTTNHIIGNMCTNDAQQRSHPIATNFYSYNGQKSSVDGDTALDKHNSSIQTNGKLNSGFVTKYQSMLSHHGLFKRSPEDPIYYCHYPECQLSFKRDYYLKRHLLTHSIEKPFKCDYPECSAAFKQNCLLNRHKLIHSGEKPYVCTFDNCDKRFARVDKLKCHLVTHTGEKRYICTFADCDKKFSRADKLRCHMLRHTGERPFKCAWINCGREFSEKRSLNNHIKTHLIQF